MTSLNSSHYGHGPELVPQSLTAYRHFRFDANTYMLRPTNINPSDFRTVGEQPDVSYPLDGPAVAQCFATPNKRAHADCPKCLGRGLIESVVGYWAPSMTGLAERFQNVSWVNCDCLRECERVPNVECVCGIYASYSPETDFFASYIKSVQTEKERRKTDFTRKLFGIDLPVLFAAVECTGRVLMGEYGVRAEKVRPLGLTVDWHHVEVMEAINSEGAGPKHVSDYIHMVTVSVSRLYGIPVYPDRTTMLRDFPQPDLSAIIGRSKEVG